MPRQQVLEYAAGEFLRRARKCALFSLLLLVALVPTVQLGAQSAAPLTVVKAGRLLDPRTGNVLAPAAVFIVGDKVKQIGSPLQISAPAGAKIIDLGGATLLPGLIDSHTHLLLDAIVPPEAESARRNNGDFAPALLLAIVESPNKRVLLGAQLAREDLESGITTVRNLGHSGIDGDTELRDAINAGRVPGPRMLASGRKLITRGEYVQNLNPVLAEVILQQEFLLIDGTDRAREQSGGTHSRMLMSSRSRLMRISRLLSLQQLWKRHIVSISRLPSMPSTAPAFRARLTPEPTPSSTPTR